MGNLWTKTNFWDKNMILGIYELKLDFWELCEHRKICMKMQI